MMARRLCLTLVCSLLLLPAMAQAQEADSPFVTKPYLQIGQNPAPGSLQLLWHAPDVDADWSLEFQSPSGKGRPWRKGETPTFRRVAVAGIEPHRVYRSSLTGLEPGGLFNYVVS